MPESKFDLNRVLQSANGISTPIDYSGITVPTADGAQQIMQGFEDWRKSQGYQTEEEKQIERERKLKEGYERAAGLDNGASATDYYYAFQTDPQKRAEWDRGAKLTTLAGLSVATAPWTLTYGAKSLKNIYDLAKFGFTNPVGKTAAKKALVSTLGSEAAYQLSEWEKVRLNNSSFGQTNLNKYFAQPMLSAIGVMADPDMAMTHAATKQGAKMIGSGAESLISSGAHFISPDANEVWDVGENFAKANVTEIDNMFKRNLKKGGNRSQALVKTGVDSFSPHFADQQTITLLDQARQKFGDDFLLEAIPANSEYFANFEQSTREAAKEAFEREMLTGEGLIANGTLSRMSGEEVAQRGFAKQQGYGNNNIVLLRSAPRKETLTVGKTLENNAPIYSMLGDPGIVDKYIIAPRGTSMINLGIDHDKYMEKVARIQNLQNQYLTMFNKGLSEGSRDKAIRGFRGYMWAQQAMPSTMQHYNVLAGRHVVPDPNVKTQAVADILNERARAVGQGITGQLDSAIDMIDKREIGSILSGDAPILTTGLTREYKDLPEILRVGSKWEITGKNHTVGSYPLVMSDATEVMYVPHMKQVTDRLAPLMTDHLSTTQSHAANGFRSRIPLFTKIPRATPDNYVKAASGMFGPQMTDALVYNSIDSTAGAGLLPSVSIINPFDGKFKTLVVPFRPNGKFRAIPGLKIGGTIPSYLKNFKGN